MDTKVKNSIISTAILSAVIFMFLMLIPQLVALGKGAIASDEFQLKFFSFSIWGIGFFILLGMLWIAELTITEKDAMYGSSLAFNSPGETQAIQTSYFKNPWKLALLSVIVFSFAGLFVAFTGKSFTGIGSL